MGFLDKMVGSMIKRETGFDPTRLVRKVGGKKMLMMGGAALAGGLLASAAQRQTSAAQQTGGRGAGATSLPPRSNIPGGAPAKLPPLPGSSPAPTPTTLPPKPPSPAPSAGPPATGLPPVPGSTSSPPASAAEPELPGELVYSIVRTMVATALADGQLDPEEKAQIDGRLAEADLSDDQVAQIRRDLVVPASVETLAASLPPGEDPDTLLQFAVLVSRADGVASAEERSFVESLAAAMGRTGDDVTRIESELFPS